MKYFVNLVASPLFKINIEVRKFILIFTNLIGVHLSMDQKKIAMIRLFVVYMLGLTWLIMCLNGCYQNFGDSKKLIHAMLPNAFITVFIGRVYNLQARRTDTFDTNLQMNLEKFYEKYERDKRYRAKLKQRARESELYTKFLALGILICYHILPFPSVYMYWRTGEKFLYMHNYLPFTDPKSLNGFIINMTLLNLLVPVCYVSMIGTEMIFLFYGYQVVPKCDILCYHLEELDEELQRCGEEENFNSNVVLRNHFIQETTKVINKKEEKRQNRQSRLIEIIQEHREYNEYIQDLVFLMEIPCFFAGIFNSLSIGMAIATSFNISLLVGIVFSK